MDNETKFKIANFAQSAIIRTQLDALIKVLDSDKSEQFSQETLNAVADVYDKFKNQMPNEEFVLFRSLVEQGLFKET